jgi:hypothetical protein
LIIVIIFFVKLFWPYDTGSVRIKIPGTGEIELKHDSGGKIGSGGFPGSDDWGPLIEFTPPDTPFLVETVKIGACLKQGYTRESVAGENFTIEIWDENLTVLGSSAHPINIFREFPQIDWTEIDINDVEVQGKFYLLTWFGESYNKVIIGARDEGVPYSNYGRKGGLMQDREKYMNPEHGFPAGWMIRIAGMRAPNVLIKLVNEDNHPMVGIEVELWKVVNDITYSTGSQHTNNDGIAALYAPPGTYIIIINTLTLPQGYNYPMNTQVIVTEEGITQKTIQLQTTREDGG